MTRKKRQEYQRQKNSQVEFQSVLRLRPLLKKERDEHVILEPTSPTTVVLHPLHSKELLSPSSALVMKNNVHMDHDLEFSFDTVFGQDASQEKVYFSLGHPIAQAAMDPLKSASVQETPRRTSLVVSMGLIDAGKSYSSWGESIVSKRKSPGDGLVPRIMDSLFSQSKHHINRKKGHYFTVKCSFLQIDQMKGNSKEPPKIHDLLKPVNRTTLIPGLPSIPLPALPSPSRSKSSISSSRMDSGGSSSSIGFSSSSSLNDPVHVEQDPVSSDCQVVNGQEGMCKNIEDGRALLQTAMENRKKLKNKRLDRHVLIQMQPVVLNRAGKVVSAGGQIAILDMASIDHSSGNSKSTPGRNRVKDSLPNRSDAHAAVMHCLRALKNNQIVPTKMTPDYSSSDSEEDTFGETSGGMKKVPFLQHKLTMLLQPFFSAHHNDITMVTLFLTAYTGHRDHGEKKELLQELQRLYRPPPQKNAQTGLPLLWSQNLSAGATLVSNRQRTASHASDADDEGSGQKKSRRDSRKSFAAPLTAIPMALDIERNSSMSYSESSGDDGDDNEVATLPPPVAPDYKSPRTRSSDDVGNGVNIRANGPSAPYETSVLGSSKSKIHSPSSRVGHELPLISLKARPTVGVEAGTVFSDSDKSRGSSPKEENVSPPSVSRAKKEQKFSGYIKTFNKVVVASKKKSRKVLEKMTTGSGSNGPANQCTSTEHESRVKELEEINASLRDEVSQLRIDNITLREENKTLRSNRHHHDSDDDSSICVSPPKEKWTTTIDSDDDRSTDTSCDESTFKPSPPFKREALFDNQLFEQMAMMNNKYG